MLQGNGLDGQRTVFVDGLLAGGIDGMEVNLVVEVVTEQLHLLLQHILQGSWRIDGQPCRTAQQAKRAEHAYQSETMVAMQMGDEDGTDLGEAKP